MVERTPDVVTGASDDLLWRHLKSLPAFRALLRAVEARYFQQIDIPEPILDLGCGDGHFARMVFDESPAVGVDPWWSPLHKAQRAESYRLPVQAMGDALPFADATFASVISNSVLEHIPDVQPVLAEANRVLRPGGKLVITMPSHLFTEYLGGAALLEPLGLGNAYRRFFNRISRHAHTDSADRWAQRLALAGFRVHRWHYYFSRKALRALEVGHLQGLPSALLHFTTGHWILAPWRESLRPTERWLRPYYDEDPPVTAGAYIFFEARKVGNGPVEAALPAVTTRPVTVEAPLPVNATTSEGAEVSLATAAAQVDATEAAPLVAAEPALATTVDTAPPVQQEPRLMRVGLFLLTLLFGLLGQSVLSSGTGSVGGGLVLYAIAFLFFCALLLYQPARRHAEASPTATFPRRRLLFPLALLLALQAQRQGAATGSLGAPWLALLFWVFAGAIAFFALDERIAPANTRRSSPLLNPSTLLLASALFLVALLLRLVALQSHPFMLNGIETSLGLDAVAVLRGGLSNPFSTGFLTNPTLPLYLLAVPVRFLGRNAVALRLLSALVGAATVPVLYLLARRLWSERVALVAALLLTSWHLHLQYSRLGLNNVWDPLLGLLVFGLLAFARSQGTRRPWLFAGLALGLSAYLYTASHLLPFALFGVTLYFFLFDRETIRTQGRHMLAGLALATVVALPQYLFYTAHPGIFMERANTLGIFQSDWLVRQVQAFDVSAWGVVLRQFWQGALAFTYGLDTSANYNPGITLLRLWPALFFMLGIAISIWRLHQLRYALLLIWYATTVLFAAILLVDAPASHRVLFAAPAVVLLVAIGLTWAFEQAVALVKGTTDDTGGRHLLVLQLVVVLLFAISSFFFYFGAYRASARFGDRNTEIAYEIGLYLQTLDADSTVYFHGPPVMYVTFPTIPFLAPAFQPGVNLFDVSDPDAPLPGSPSAGSPRVFLFLPERSSELEKTRQRYPGGSLQTFEGRLASPLFLAYEVEP